MLVRIIKTYRNVVAICDADLLGKRFEEGKLQLDVKENFFKGEKTSEKRAIEIMRHMFEDDATFNIVGEKSVKTALKAGIISEEGIRRIKNIPFVFMLM